MTKEDIVDIESFVEEHLDLPDRVVHRYLFIYPTRRDDLKAAARHGFVQAVTWITEGRCDHDEIGRYLVTTIRWFIHDFIHNDRLITIPITEYRKRQAKEEWQDYLERTTTGTKFTSLIPFPEGVIENIPVFIDVNRQDSWSKKHRTDNDIPDTRPSILLLDDLIESMKLTDMEERALLLRMDGYTLREIGKVINKTPAGVQVILSRLKNKLGGQQKKTKITISSIKCSACAKDKPITEYYKYTNGKPRGQCKACFRGRRI